MITIDGVQYRNLEEQVKKNKDDITFILEEEGTLNKFGIHVVDEVASVDDLPDPRTYEGEFGDAYAVGTTPPYELYIYTRANGEHPTNYWFNIGEFPLPGPQGTQGIPGADGATGLTALECSFYRTTSTVPVSGTSFGSALTNFNRTPVVGDFFFQLVFGEAGSSVEGRSWITNNEITISTSSFCNYETKGVMETTGAQGPQGNPGVDGNTGPQGQQGPIGPQGNPGQSFVIAGTVANEGQLPDPSTVADNIAYLVGTQAPYDLYVQLQNSSEWFNAGIVEGVQGPQGPQGVAGESAIYYKGVFTLNALPVVGQSLSPVITNFSRTPIVGEYFLALVNGSNDVAGRTWIINLEITAVDTNNCTAIIRGITETTGARGPQGKQGNPGQDGITPVVSATATITNTVGTPSVTVKNIGTTNEPNFSFAFSNLKGEAPDLSAYATTEYVESSLNNYLPLTGGNITYPGNIAFPNSLGDITASMNFRGIMFGTHNKRNSYLFSGGLSLSTIDGKETQYTDDRIFREDIGSIYLPNSAGTIALTNDITTALEPYATTEYVNSKVSGVYVYKGSVATYNDLPSSGQVIGDVYNVEDTGDNYAWDGTAWDKLSGTVDLSAYATTANMQTYVTQQLQPYETTANITAKLSNYPTTEQVTSDIANSTTDMATKTWVTGTALAPYATTANVESAISSLNDSYLSTSGGNVVGDVHVNGSFYATNLSAGYFKPYNMDVPVLNAAYANLNTVVALNSVSTKNLMVSQSANITNLRCNGTTYFDNSGIVVGANGGLTPEKLILNNVQIYPPATSGNIATTSYVDNAIANVSTGGGGSNIQIYHAYDFPANGAPTLQLFPSDYDLSANYTIMFITWQLQYGEGKIRYYNTKFTYGYDNTISSAWNVYDPENPDKNPTLTWQNFFGANDFNINSDGATFSAIDIVAISIPKT